MEPIILASGSLRRQEYFRLMGLPFSIIPTLIDESQHVFSSPQEATEKLAVMKVDKIISLLQGSLPPWICGADTVTAMDGKIFGKPKDQNDARSMLQAIQGREHQVVTAIALFSGKTKHTDCRSVESRVTFRSLSEAEIEWYINTGEWQGVAGGYRIQGLAACFVSSIQGSYSGIVGLPLEELYVMLRENGYPYGSLPV